MPAGGGGRAGAGAGSPAPCAHPCPGSVSCESGSRWDPEAPCWLGLRALSCGRVSWQSLVTRQSRSLGNPPQPLWGTVGSRRGGGCAEASWAPRRCRPVVRPGVQTHSRRRRTAGPGRPGRRREGAVGGEGSVMEASAGASGENSSDKQATEVAA